MSWSTLARGILLRRAVLSMRIVRVILIPLCTAGRAGRSHHRRRGGTGGLMEASGRASYLLCWLGWHGRFRRGCWDWGILRSSHL
jgi:hypothetical protein